MISGLGGISPQKATFAGYPLPGIQPCLVNAKGKEIKGNGKEGLLCIKFPWPSMIRTTLHAETKKECIESLVEWMM